MYFRLRLHFCFIQRHIGRSSVSALDLKAFVYIIEDVEASNYTCRLRNLRISPFRFLSTMSRYYIIS
jgi:hypothetical protein